MKTGQVQLTGKYGLLKRQLTETEAELDSIHHGRDELEALVGELTVKEKEKAEELEKARENMNRKSIGTENSWTRLKLNN